MTRATLRNGMRVIVRENRLSPSVAIRLCLQTGSVQDPPGRDGLALAVGLLLDEGTRRRTGKQIAERIDFLGAETDVLVNRHATVLVASALREHLEEILRLQSETVREPNFPAREIAKIRGQMMTGVLEEEHDTRAAALRLLSRRLYPRGHPYRRTGGGDRKSVRAIARNDIVRFHKDRYHPSGAILVIVGDVEEKRALRIAERVYGGWKRAGDPAPPSVPDAKGPAEPAADAAVIPDKAQCDLVFGWVGIRRNDPDFYRAAVLNQILGAFGMGGRLGNRIREEEGLAYSVHGSVHASIGAGPFLIRAGVHPDHVIRAVRIIREEVGRIRRELAAPRELREVRDFLIDSIPLRLETNDGVAAFLLREEYYGLGPDYLDRYREEIRGVTREEVRRVARRLLRKDGWAVAAAGTPLPEPLERTLPGRRRARSRA